MILFFRGMQSVEEGQSQPRETEEEEEDDTGRKMTVTTDRKIGRTMSKEDSQEEEEEGKEEKNEMREVEESRRGRAGDAWNRQQGKVSVNMKISPNV